MVGKTKQNKPRQSIIIGRCYCDDVVKYPFYWCEELIKEAEGKLNIIDLQKENFIEEKFLKLMEKHNPEFVFLNGHGDEFSAMGFNKTPVIIANKNDYLLKGKIVNVISCFTAKFLAPCAMDKGCRGYIGYKNYFYICYIENEPEKDIIAKMFQEAVNSGSKVLINGGSIKDAFEKSQEIYEKRINECKGKYFQSTTSEGMKDNLQDIISALIWNKKHQIYFSLED
ncbi:hypothetical protein KAT24_01670 [Candidatus Pacearchaeota archaeon]|nr:hypothetical protein [Candidatus Pacearchaeota archaeon]